MRYPRIVLFTLLAVAFAVTPLAAQTSKMAKPAAAVKTSELKVPLRVTTPASIKNVHLTSRFSLNTSEKQKVNNATKLLVNKQFGNRVKQSTAVKPRVKVLTKVGNKITAEALIVFRAKNTYTATMSKLNYNIVGDKVTLTAKVPHYAPRVTALKKPAQIDSATKNLKATLLADLKIPLTQGYGPKALTNTPCPEFQSAVNATNSVYNTFRTAFGSAQKLIGSQSTKSTIMNVLQNGTRLVAWNNIGHGNPYSIVQWDDTPIWHSDFNTTTRFKGVYNSVILLNSCNVCKSPYSLKNAIKQHQPRTYIGGSISLPVGRSEYVDVDFWKYALLQNKTMGWALNKASQNHSLTGAFCLDGFNGSFVAVETAKLTEDCIRVNPTNVRTKKINNRWKVVDGSHWLLDFGTKKADAEKAVRVIKHYKLDRQCFVGRPNAPMQYYTVKGCAPMGTLPGEDANAFNPANVQAKKINNRWKVVDGSHWLLDFNTKEAQAKNAVKIIKHYGFKYICFVGRPHAPMMYFRR